MICGLVEFLFTGLDKDCLKSDQISSESKRKKEFDLFFFGPLSFIFGIISRCAARAVPHRGVRPVVDQRAVDEAIVAQGGSVVERGAAATVGHVDQVGEVIHEVT